MTAAAAIEITPEEAAEGWAPEILVYGGAVWDDGKIKSIWLDEARTRLVFSKEPASRVPGGRYEFAVKRVNDHVTTRRGDGRYLGRLDDADAVAGMEAADRAAHKSAAVAAAERKARREPRLAALLGQVEAVAAGMDWTAREGLVSLITQRIYRAERSR
jgi:hypothetical protein